MKYVLNVFMLQFKRVSIRKENEMETDDAHERRLAQALLAIALFLDYFDFCTFYNYILNPFLICPSIDQ